MKTFLQARAEIAETLRAHGWSLSPALKVPYATSPSGALRLWFKPQAVYFTEGNYHTLNGARTLSYDLDIRKMTGEDFAAHVRKWFPETSRDMHRREVHTPRGGATHKRTLSEFTAEVKALLFTRGFGPYLIDQLIAPNYEVLQAAWRQGKAPCAVSDFFASKMKGRRDPAKLSAKDRARAKKLEVFAMVNGFSHLSGEELELVRRFRNEREVGKARRQTRRKR